MAIQLNTKNPEIRLKKIGEEKAQEEIAQLLLVGETVAMAFKAGADRVIFTNLRIIAINVQGFTGTKRTYSSIPYSKVQAFSVSTEGFMTTRSEREMFISVSDTFTMNFIFDGEVDIAKIGRTISEFMLK